MSRIAKVQARGQVTVPQEIPDACTIEPGSELLFVKTGTDRFECQVLPQTGSLLAFIEENALHDLVIDVERLREEATAAEGRAYLRRLGQ